MLVICVFVCNVTKKSKDILMVMMNFSEFTKL